MSKYGICFGFFESIESHWIASVGSSLPFGVGFLFREYHKMMIYQNIIISLRINYINNIFNEFIK